MGVLAGELGVVYEGFVVGAGVGLGGLPVQYADFAVWQREWLAGERLAGAGGVLAGGVGGFGGVGLADGSSAAGGAGASGGGFGLGLIGGGGGGVACGWARECQATLFMVLLAGFAAVLGRLVWAG